MQLFCKCFKPNVWTVSGQGEPWCDFLPPEHRGFKFLAGMASLDGTCQSVLFSHLIYILIGNEDIFASCLIMHIMESD